MIFNIKNNQIINNSAFAQSEGLIDKNETLIIEAFQEMLDAK